MSAPSILDSRHHHSLGGDTRVCDDAVAGLNHVTTRFSPEVLTATGYSPSIRVEGVPNTVPVVFQYQENPWHPSFPYGVGGLSTLGSGAHALRTPVSNTVRRGAAQCPQKGVQSGVSQILDETLHVPVYLPQRSNRFLSFPCQGATFHLDCWAVPTQLRSSHG